MHEEELSRELAALKDELASFQPRPGRLDRDQTMFLAGRASAHTPTRPPGRAGRWVWPAAFGAMTAMAAALLVVVLSQPSGEVAGGAEGTPAAQLEQKSEPQKAPDRPWASQQLPRESRLAWGVSTELYSERVHPDTAYFRQLERVLALETDQGAVVVSPMPHGGGPTAGPMTYPQLLHSLLGHPATSGPPTHPFHGKSPLQPGAES